MREAGSSMQEVTIRQWLIDDSHIVGPRKERTMEYIAIVTQDPHLLADTHAFLRRVERCVTTGERFSN